MATNIELNEELVAEAMKISGQKTKKAAVNEALEDYVRRHKQLGILELFGKIDYDPDYDYKVVRSREQNRA